MILDSDVIYYLAVYPPSMIISLPVIHLLLFERKKATKLATSSGSPMPKG